MLWSPPRPTESDSEAGPSNLRFKKPFLHWASLIAPSLGFHDSSVGKESACYAGDPGSIPRLGKIPGEGIGYPFQYSGLENSMDRGAWQATVHGVAKTQTRLSDFHFTSLHDLTKSSYCYYDFFVPRVKTINILDNIIKTFSY